MPEVDDWRKEKLKRLLPIEEFAAVLKNPSSVNHYSTFNLVNETSDDSFTGPTIVLQPLKKKQCLIMQWNIMGDEVAIQESGTGIPLSRTVFDVRTSRPFALDELYGTQMFSRTVLKFLECNNCLHFKSYAAAIVYQMCYRDRIIHMPNAHPMNHWRWTEDANIIIDQNHDEGYTGLAHEIYYGFSSTIEENRAWDSPLRKIIWFGSILDMIGETVDTTRIPLAFIKELWANRESIKSFRDIEHFDAKSSLSERILSEIAELISSNEVGIYHFDEVCNSAQRTVNSLLME